MFSDPYNHEEDYHAHTEQNEDSLITPDQHNDYDTIGYDDGYGYTNEQHPDQHSGQSLAMAFEAWGNYADKVPYTFMVLKDMQEQTIKTHPFLCLFDSGLDVTWIHQRAIP